jgi:hypothetical protein
MKSISLVLICSLVLLLSNCGNHSETKDISTFDWSAFSDNLRDSLVSMEGKHIPNSVTGTDANEPVDFSKLQWILKNSSIKQLELLLLNHSDGVVKGIALKGLVRKKAPSLFDYFKYAFEQEVCVLYYSSGSKLGGYALYLINYDVRAPSNLSIYFDKKQAIEIERIIEGKDFKCD